MLISKSEYSATGATLSRYETAHGFTFPQECRVFLLEYDSGEAPETDFRLSGVSSDLVSFYELRDDGDGLKLHEIELLAPAFLKDHMLPIASNVSGDNIFTYVEGREDGKVSFRYRDRPKRYAKLADSFRTFIQKCKSKKLGRCYTIEDRTAMRGSTGNFEPSSAIALSEWQKEIDYFNRIHQEQVEF